MSSPSWIPESSCSICQECKILAALLMDHFSRLHLQQATVRDNVLLLTKSWLASAKQWKQWKQCVNNKNNEFPSSVFLFLPISLRYNWHASCFSCVQLFATLWTAASQAPLSNGILQAWILERVAMPFSRGSFLFIFDPGIKPVFLMPSALVGMFFTTSATWEAQ